MLQAAGPVNVRLAVFSHFRLGSWPEGSNIQAVRGACIDRLHAADGMLLDHVRSTPLNAWTEHPDNPKPCTKQTLPADDYSFIPQGAVPEISECVIH